MLVAWNQLPTVTTLSFDHISVTVVVALRNEEDNVKALLDSFQLQTHSNFEVILINDHSEDQTSQRIKESLSFYSFDIQLVELNLDEKGKKMAIRKGVALSESELIMTTDADCLHSPLWIETFVRYYSQFNKPKMLSGPVKFSPTHNFFEESLTVEFGSLILTGAASIGLNTPNMCNAANLGFQRTAFLEQNNYAEHAHIPTGDDEFFLHQIAKEDPSQIKFIKDKNGIVTTTPPHSFGHFIQQRIRWASKWRHYKNKGPQWSAISVFFLHFSFIFALCQLLIGFGNWYIFGTALFFRIIGEYFFNKAILKWQGDKELSKYSFLLSLLYPFYAFGIGLLATFTKYSWKNRKFDV